MPELPEVETVVRDLRPSLAGRRIADVSVGRCQLRRPWRRAWRKALIGASFAELRRRGKWIIADLFPRGHVLVHLGMTGQLTLASATEPVADHTHVVFELDSECVQLRFRDVRRFGSVEFVESSAAVDAMLEKKLGPEPWELPTAWYERIRASSRCLKAILMDQRVVAGVGNIYADEALFEANLSPTLRGNRVTRLQVERLKRAIITVLQRAISARGSTIRDFIGGSGLQGGFQRQFLVYGREGKPCARCGRVIVCRRLSGRSTHYCPGCQSAENGRPRR